MFQNMLASLPTRNEQAGCPPDRPQESQAGLGVALCTDTDRITSWRARLAHPPEGKMKFLSGGSAASMSSIHPSRAETHSCCIAVRCHVCVHARTPAPDSFDVEELLLHRERSSVQGGDFIVWQVIYKDLPAALQHARRSALHQQSAVLQGMNPNRAVGT